MNQLLIYLTAAEGQKKVVIKSSRTPEEAVSFYHVHVLELGTIMIENKATATAFPRGLPHEHVLARGKQASLRPCNEHRVLMRVRKSR